MDNQAQPPRPPATLPVNIEGAAEPTTPTVKPVNIIIPMGRVTKESFTEAGYRQPIPMINVVGRPILFWLIDNLDLHADDKIYIAVPPHVNIGFNLDNRLKTTFPTLNIKVTELQFDTKGPLETLLIAAHAIEASRDRYRTLCMDCS